MKPSTRPLDLRDSVMASVAEEITAKNFGRLSVGTLPSQNACGSKVETNSSPGRAPSTSIFNSAVSPAANRSSAAGNGARNSRAHEHASHAREHGAEQRRQSGELDFFKEIDADRTIVPLFGEKHFDESAENNRLHKTRAGLQRGFRDEAKGRIFGLAAFNEIIRQHAFDHGGEREMRQAPAESPRAGSPSCRRRASIVSMPVPDTTPNCPRRDTARASFQFEIATPMPPWIILGNTVIGEGWQGAGKTRPFRDGCRINEDGEMASSIAR